MSRWLFLSEMGGWPGALLVLSAGTVLAGCGLFGETAPAASQSPVSAESPASGASGSETASAAAADARPFASGVLNEAAQRAPADSAARLLATIAGELGWETEVSQDPVLREAIAAGDFADRVEARLLGLYFRKGFSVLPSVGEGHEFTRDAVVRGPVSNAHFFARSRDPVRIIFLDRVDNIVIIYAKNAGQPQVFNRIAASTVALRQSRLDQYLN